MVLEEWEYSLVRMYILFEEKHMVFIKSGCSPPCERVHGVISMARSSPWTVPVRATLRLLMTTHE